jgi:hypothetical protein
MRTEAHGQGVATRAQRRLAMARARFGAWLALAGLLAATLVAGGGDRAVVAQDVATPETAVAANPTWLTFVAFYAYDQAQDLLVLSPLGSDADYTAVATMPDPAQVSGVADFTSVDNDGLPRITMGETVLDAYALDDDDPDTAMRWLWFDDASGERPATLVLQVEAMAGPYTGAIGTATFVSRGSKTGGVMVITLIVATGA